MKNIAVIIVSILFLTSCSVQRIELANGKKVTKREYEKGLERAFNESFGKMTKEEKELMSGVTIIIDTMTVVPDTLK